MKEIKEEIRTICTYHGKEGTSGCLLDEDRIAQIFALIDKQKSDTIKEVKEKIRLRMIKEANTPLKERKNGWDILREVQDILDKL